MNDDSLVSIRSAALEIGVNVSTLSRQIKAGLIRSHAGKVRIAEVRADRAANLQWCGSRIAKRKLGDAVDQNGRDACTADRVACTDHLSDIETMAAVQQVVRWIAAEAGCDPDRLAMAIGRAVCGSRIRAPLEDGLK